ncbi:metallophosphoesterase [Tsukamurella pseudospumae]|uniref:Serine/threonine protein phosphatase n=1 Tax=Tsukamurella pseudospumae TaxID=239498 RepID=A0A138AEL1_9ACTN|nr:metallophosphoesterase [Tsukamurella pseudospumae]KXP08795.1 serine/threonine protein phosphatase [Tsukamurella pseudospumae]
MTRFFTADLHLGHRLIADLRGFSSVGAHDAEITAPLYALDPDDELWVLGDVSCGGHSVAESALAQLRSVPAPMHLVAGNHDLSHPLNGRSEEWRARYAEVFASVSIAGRINLGETEVLLSHFPNAGTPDRYAREKFTQWQLPDLRRWLVHGHTHSSARRSAKRSICVSLEAWDLRPASEEELEIEMRKR